MLTPDEFYSLMDLSVSIEPLIATPASVTGVDLVGIVDAEQDLVCLAPRDKAETLVKILNASEALVERD